MLCGQRVSSAILSGVNIARLCEKRYKWYKRTAARPWKRFASLVRLPPGIGAGVVENVQLRTARPKGRAA